jgi:diguanylate cyclase (GGDEF)-like protein/PAS domain S-box-containing protein
MSNVAAHRISRALSSLKLRLALTGMAVIALSVALTVVLVLRDVSQRTERALLDSQLGAVEKLAGVLSSRVVALQLALRHAAVGIGPSTLNDAAALDWLKSEPVLRGLFSSVFLATPDGRVIATADRVGTRATGSSIAERGYFTQTVQEGRPVVSEPRLNPMTGEPVVVLTMPVRGDDGGLRAVLAGTLSLTTSPLLSDLTRHSSRDSDPISTLVVDSQGRVIAHPNNEWLLRHAAAEPKFAEAIAHWVAQGRPVEPQGAAQRLGESVVANAGVPATDWVIFQVGLAEVLLGGVSAGAQRAVWLGAGVSMAGALVILLATAVLLRPLGRLRLRALRLLRDDLADEAGWPRSNDEIGELSKAFQHVMAERAKTQRSTEQLVARLQAVMGNAPVGITFSRDRKFDLVSVHFCRMFGYTADELIGQSARCIYPSEEAFIATGSRLDAAFAAGQPFSEELELVHRDGRHFWGHLQAATVRKGDPSAGSITIIFDVTERRREREQLSWSATHDPLTELHNRRGFEDRVATHLGERRHSEVASALFIDLDDFKAVNDSAGHPAGDEMLRNVAAILRLRVRTDDIVARLGGDEFAVLLRSCDAATAAKVAEQIRAMVEAHRLVWQGQVLQVGASIGVVEIDQTLDNVAALLAAADAACYEAKRAGRNTVRNHPSRLRLVNPNSP